jgi:molecular chaperone GrpE
LFLREIYVPDPMQATPEAAPVEGACPDTPLADLEARLKAAESEVARLNDEWLRARAEIENVRRRAVEDVAKAHKFGLESFATGLLAVRDSLEAALAVPSPTVESLKQGVEITARQLAGAFEKASLKEVSPQGEKFDPHRHQAISQVPSDQPPNTVVTVVQKGYLLHDRVIRPALVMVASAPAEQAPASPAEPPPAAPAA